MCRCSLASGGSLDETLHRHADLLGEDALSADGGRVGVVAAVLVAREARFASPARNLFEDQDLIARRDVGRSWFADTDDTTDPFQSSDVRKIDGQPRDTGANVEVKMIDGSRLGAHQSVSRRDLGVSDEPVVHARRAETVEHYREHVLFMRRILRYP